MTTVDEAAAYLDELLDAAAFREHELENGLLVDSGRAVRRLGAAVNTSARAIEQAAESGVDLLIVHHPSWSYIDLRTHQPKMDRLRELGIALYGAHASLDGAPEIGTGAALARLIGLEADGRFATYEGAQAGLHGPWQGTFEELTAAVAAGVGGEPEIHRNAARCTRVGIVTGAGGMTGWLDEALDLGCDTYLTGEGSMYTRSFAREAGMNLILAGHYRTEAPGIQALAERAAADLGLEWVFVDDEPIG